MLNSAQNKRGALTVNSHGHHPHFNSSTRVNPILKWAGGKSALLPQLIAHFPTDFKRYIEPFFGGGAVFFALKNNTPALLNEANPELVNLYNVLAHHPQSLMNQRDILSLQYSEEYYYQLRAQKPLCPIEQAARTLFLNKTGFNGLYRQNAKGGFNVPFGKKRECPRLYNKGNLMAASVRLNAATLSNADFEGALNAAGAGDFVYCDPPYQPLNPTSSFTGYTAAGFTQADQRRLKGHMRGPIGEVLVLIGM